eukprot:Mycagemm_TRINITY_DN7815_c0_g1::TRINITY_DN7815_c0_g1_i1::g.2450::m.2450 type:complete len:176 gc:universal TRINITY_DN7815_c0_g1_i1:531-4(-)
MLAHLLEEGQRGALLLHNGTHATKRSALESLAAIQRVAILEQAKVLLAEIIDEGTCSIKLPQGKLVVVAVVEYIDEISVEGVDVIEYGELVQNDGELIVIALRRELHLPDVETPDTLDRVALVHNCRSFALCLGEDDVHKVLRGGHLRDLLEVIDHHRRAEGAEGRSRERARTLR